jgi:hypothetical protein
MYNQGLGPQNTRSQFQPKDVELNQKAFPEPSAMFSYFKRMTQFK